jgi:hypothetical protein
MDHGYHPAANMGGIGFIETTAVIVHDNTLINTHMVDPARNGASRPDTSPACVGPVGPAGEPGRHPPGVVTPTPLMPRTATAGDNGRVVVPPLIRDYGLALSVDSTPTRWQPTVGA